MSTTRNYDDLKEMTGQQTEPEITHTHANAYKHANTLGHSHVRRMCVVLVLTCENLAP